MGEPGAGEPALPSTGAPASSSARAASPSPSSQARCSGVQPKRAERGEVARTNQIECLVEWAKLLKPGMVVAVRASTDKEHIEGKYWLLLVDSEAIEMPEDMVHSTNEFEEGWLVVRGRWYSLEQKSPRGYTLLPAEKIVLVNAMIRLPNVIFAGGAVGKAPRESRSGLQVLEDDMRNLILGSV